jgi:hypothetical protein
VTSRFNAVERLSKAQVTQSRYAPASPVAAAAAAAAAAYELEAAAVASRVPEAGGGGKGAARGRLNSREVESKVSPAQHPI